MYRTMLKSKIHRATVTQANLHYVGSVTIDETLMEAADLLPGELVQIVDITNGARLETYVITGERDSGVLGINGAAAHLVEPGDLVILIAYGVMDSAEAHSFQPKIVFVDEANRIVERGSDAAHAPDDSGLVSGAAVPEPQTPEVAAQGNVTARVSPSESARPAVTEPAATRPPETMPAETADAARLDALLRTES